MESFDVDLALSRGLEHNEKADGFATAPQNPPQIHEVDFLPLATNPCSKIDGVWR